MTALGNPRGFGPIEWVRRYGYLYPAEVFQAALLATFPHLARHHGNPLPIEARAAVGEYETAHGEWLAACEGRYTPPLPIPYGQG